MNERFTADRLKHRGTGFAGGPPRPPKPPRVQKPKAWSHQDDLQAHIGKTIVIVRDGVDAKEYVLLAADQFTLQVYVSEAKSALTVFKHSIIGYMLVKD